MLDEPMFDRLATSANKAHTIGKSDQSRGPSAGPIRDDVDVFFQRKYAYVM